MWSRRNPHKFHYQRRRGDSPLRYEQAFETFPSNRPGAGHSGRGTWPRYRTSRARVPTRSRHRRRY
jgi:hypothetical protein